MSESAAAVRELVALVTDVTGGATAGRLLSSPFEEGSIAAAEQGEIDLAGITDDGVTSMRTVRGMLDSYSRSAAAHLRAAAVLAGADGGATLLLSITALSRISCEASATAFWLCDPRLGWDERLRRCSHLQFKAFQDGLRPSQRFIEVLSTPWGEEAVAGYRDGMNEVIGFAQERHWTYRNRSPSDSNWSKGVPSFTRLMRDLVADVGEPAAVGQMLYSSGSGVVHSNPILVDLVLSQLTPPAERYAAALKIKYALLCRRLLWDRIAEWTGWECEGDRYDEAERITQVLTGLRLDELRRSPDPTGDVAEYRRYLSEALRLMQDAKYEDES